MDVTFYTHYFDAKKLFGKNIEEVVDFEDDLKKIVSHVKSISLTLRKMEYTKDRLAMYLHDFSYDEMAGTLLIEFKSAKHSKIRKVVNTSTWKEHANKKKGKLEGDEETTLILIKFYSSNEAYCVMPNNSDGISLPKMKDYLNTFVKKYHKEVVPDKIMYKIETLNMVSDDFLKALMGAKRIKAVRLIVDQKDLDVSENKQLANRDDLSSDVGIYLKPVGRGKGIHQSTVKEFYKIYKDEKKKIKKIYVDADKSDGNPLKFDTEKMKDKYIKDIAESITGEPVKEDLIKEMKNIIDKYE